MNLRAGNAIKLNKPLTENHELKKVYSTQNLVYFVADSVIKSECETRSHRIENLLILKFELIGGKIEASALWEEVNATCKVFCVPR